MDEVADGGDDAVGFEGWLGSASVAGAVDEPYRDRGQSARFGVEEYLPGVGGAAFDMAGGAGRPVAVAHAAVDADEGDGDDPGAAQIEQGVVGVPGSEAGVLLDHGQQVMAADVLVGADGCGLGVGGLEDG